MHIPQSLWYFRYALCTSILCTCYWKPWLIHGKKFISSTLKILNPIWASFLSLLPQDHRVELHVCNWKQYWTVVTHFSSLHLESHFTLFLSLGSAEFKFLFIFENDIHPVVVYQVVGYFFIFRSAFCSVVLSCVEFWAGTLESIELS